MIWLALLLLCLLVVGVIVVIIWLRLHRLRARAVVQTLAMIVGQNLPLVAGLRAAARGEDGALARILVGIADRLLVGDALSTALRHAFVTCPGHIVGALQGAEQGGTLPSVLRSLAVDMRRQHTTSRSTAPPLAYFCVLAVIVPALVSMMIVFFVPKFHAIFLDFGVNELPAVTQSLVTASSFAAEHTAVFLALLFAAAVLLIHVGVGRQFLVRVPDRFQFIRALVDTVAWHLPVFRRVGEIRALARQLPIMQAAIGTGQDLPAAARQAACVDANHYARRRLRRWADAIEQGAKPLVAARRLHFPGPLLTTLSDAAGDRLSSSLEYLTTYYRSLLVHWEEVLVSLLMPAVVLVWAACVGYVAVAFLLPLRTLLDSLIAEVY
jgi:type II secretory pathway component PulF